MGEKSNAMASLLARHVGRAAIRRTTGPATRRGMATEISAEEQLSMEKLYPGTRSSWFGTPTSQGTWDDTKKTWVIVEAYPLFAAIGGGLLICTAHCLRHLFFSPDVFLSKSNRSNAMIENNKEGQNWKGNPLRIIGSMKKDTTDPFR